MMAQDLTGKTAVELRQMAADRRQREEESFQRSDTDGFLSQWALGINAQLYEEQAKIVDNGGRARFIGLYEGDRRVKARQVSFKDKFSYGTKTMWLVHEDDPVCAKRKWIPIGARSRAQKQLGLSERFEWAPAEAFIAGSGTGLSGCASAHVSRKRNGDIWGSDAVLAEQPDLFSEK